MGHELGEGRLHPRDDVVGQRLEKGALDTQLLPVPDGASHDLAQDVAPALVAGQDAVRDQERHGAQVVRDHAQGHVVRGVVSVGLPGAAAHRREQRREEIGVVVGELALDDGRHALEAHARVHAGGGEGVEGALLVPDVLHEHEVPDLEPAVALALDAEAGAPGGLLGAGEGVALEVVDLGAGAAGPGVAHGPEVVLRAELEDALLADVGLPEPVGLAVARDAVLAPEDRHLQAVLRQAQVAGEEVPAELDRLLLEVVPEGEVAEHLEEGVVSRGHAHVLEVVVLSAGPHALLGRGRAGVVPLLAPEEHVLELVHPRVREEQRGIVLGHERRALHDAVPALLEVAEEAAADLVGRLDRVLSPAHSCSPPWASAGSRGSSPSRASFHRGQRAHSRSRTRPGAKPRRSRNAQRRGRRRAGSTRGVLAPVASGEAVEDLPLVDLAQRPGDAGVDRPPVDAALTQPLPDAEAPQPLVSHAAAGEALGEPGVVQVSLAPQALERLLDLGRLVIPLEQRPAQLRHGVVPAGQAPDRPLVRRGGRRRRRAAGHAPYCSRSKDCIVLSISSAAMSEEDWMPWILSLNSSGLLARRSASS